MRRADLGDDLVAVGLPLRLQGGLQLLEAALAERVVGRPVGLVEGPPGGVNGPLHVLGRSVGYFPQHFFGGRIDIVEPLARRGLDELTVNEHAHFTGTTLVGHVAPLPLDAR
jgi:hypothetical protein